jgi:hypothetical protein
MTPAGGIASGAVRVCLSEPGCAFDSTCPAPLVCGRDLKCRNQCEADLDCAKSTYKCVVGGQNGEKICAEPKAINPSTGEFDPGEVGGHGGGGTAGNGGSSGAVGGASGLIVAETEPNDDLAHATPYTVGTKIMATSANGDVDFFTVTTPATDLAGGFYKVTVNGVGAGVVHLEVYSLNDKGRIGYSDGAGVGQSSFYFWAASPGQTYYVRATGGSSAIPFEYTFAVSYTKIDDPYEPNDTRDTPKPIALGQAVTAYYFSGYKLSSAVSDQDWYSVELTAGPLTASLTNVATNEKLQLDITNAANETMKLGSSASLGSNVTAMYNVPAPGTYRISVIPFTFVPGSQQGAGLDVIDSFTRPYTLVVTQP